MLSRNATVFGSEAGRGHPLKGMVTPIRQESRSGLPLAFFDDLARGESSKIAAQTAGMPHRIACTVFA